MRNPSQKHAHNGAHRMTPSPSWRHRGTSLLVVACLAACGGLFHVAGASEPQGDQYSDLTELDLESLADIQVTIVSKKEEKASEVAAAVYVLTNEDLRRSGVTSIPDALRLVPGMQVARIDANVWAVSARGFNSQFANKLLVLIDGRSVYTPLHSGVFWEVQDVPFEDVERIEVIRGPGASVWGANAVNGVINIITKSTVKTHGGYLVAGGGSEDKAMATFRYGGEFGEAAHYRVYGKVNDYRHNPLLTGGTGADNWNIARGGFRTDWRHGDNQEFAFHGDYYNGEAGSSYLESRMEPPWSEWQNLKAKVAGWNVLSRWTNHLSATSDLSLQAYVDRTDRRDEHFGNDFLTTYDIEGRHQFAVTPTWGINWGAGHRVIVDEVSEAVTFTLDPKKNTVQISNAYFQSDFTVPAANLRLLLGTKLENNDFTGLSVQPNARLSWMPNHWHTIWGAVSHAVRTPSLVEESGVGFIGAIPPLSLGEEQVLAMKMVMLGNSGVENERLWAFEAGHRFNQGSSFATDVAVFFNSYKNLSAVEVGMPVPEGNPPTYFVMPMYWDNGVSAETYGLEAAADWRPISKLRLRATYGFLRMFSTYPVDPTGTAATSNLDDLTPRHTVNLQGNLLFTSQSELGLTVRHVDPLSGVGNDSYTEFDARIAWQPLSPVELAVVGRNLLSPRHAEYSGFSIQAPTYVERSVHSTIAWRF